MLTSQQREMIETYNTSAGFWLKLGMCHVPHTGSAWSKHGPGSHPISAKYRDIFLPWSEGWTLQVTRQHVKVQDSVTEKRETIIRDNNSIDRGYFSEPSPTNKPLEKAARHNLWQFNQPKMQNTACCPKFFQYLAIFLEHYEKFSLDVHPLTLVLTKIKRNLS